MYFHYPSFLLGLLFGIVLIVLFIHAIFRMSVKDDERMFRAQKRVDDYQEEDHSPE